jgi:hypothetical protein
MSAPNSYFYVQPVTSTIDKCLDLNLIQIFTVQVNVKYSPMLNYTPHCADVCGNGGTVPCILELVLDGGEWLAPCTNHFNPQEITHVPTGQEAG